MDGPVRRRCDGRALHVRGQARPLRLRRSVEARRRLPAALPAAASPAGPRGLPGRRLLPALAAARARVQALGRARRRLAHRAAGDRDAGGRHLGLHPDQRDLDHGRPDLPRVGVVLLGRSPGDQRGRLGVPRRRQRADEGHEEGRRSPAPRPRAVPRVGGVRAVRLRARPADPADAGPWRADGGDAQPAAVPAVARRGAGGRDLGRDQRLPRRHPRAGRPSLPGGASRGVAHRGLDLQGTRREGRPPRGARAADRRRDREGQEPLLQDRGEGAA